MKNNKYIYLFIFLLCGSLTATANLRHWTVTDGLSTNEALQIIELPDGRMLVNCDGVFCLSNGRTFVNVQRNRSRSISLKQYGNSYGHLWQGDSLLWLRDFYQVYLFDARKGAFRYDMAERMGSKDVSRLINGEINEAKCPDSLQQMMDSLVGPRRLSTYTTDRQGGTWIGTKGDGIYYLPPQRQLAQKDYKNEELLQKLHHIKDRQGRSWWCRPDGLHCYEETGETVYDTSNVLGIDHNQMHFILPLTDGRLLLCNLFHRLGYFNPKTRTFDCINDRCPTLDNYRMMVGACNITGQPGHVAVYTQNGAFVLNTCADTISPLLHSSAIANYSNKYNCMLIDSQRHIWAGTQNGLFCDGVRITGLRNDCVRSLVEDLKGNVWAGTSCGISRITPTVLNLTEEDGIPSNTMENHTACCLSDGRLVFAHGATTINFKPEWMTAGGDTTLPTVLTSMTVNGEKYDTDPCGGTRSLTYQQNNLAFEFSALNYASPSRTHYRYRLQGLNNKWTITDGSIGNATVTFTALHPGKYIFEAQAAIGDGDWGETLQVRFTIEPPLWLTWWAKLIYCLMGLIGIIGIIRLYLKKKKREMEAKNNERVNRLFELRNEARQQFAKNVNINAAKMSVNIEEEHFMQQLIKAVEDHLDDKEYSIEQLAYDVAVSRTKLYQQLQTMLGITPRDFIRNVRLKRAALLLTETSLTIAEIASRVGFATARNFSAHFKKMFGCLPSEYHSSQSE